MQTAKRVILIQLNNSNYRRYEMNRSEKRSEIKRLDEQIKEYEGKIFKLEETYKETKIHYETIVRDVYEPQKAYDMAPLRIYANGIYEEAEEYRKKIAIELKKSLRDTETFMSEILDIKEKIQKEKQECEDKKIALEAELDIP